MSTTDVYIYSQYFHVFWVPTFPVTKIATAKCSMCDATRTEERFGPKLTEHLKEELANTKHPFYSWTLLLLVGGLVLLAVILNLKNNMG